MTIRLNWGAGIALAYTTFAGATMGFVVFAMQRPVDLVSPDYYAEGLRHDARMAAQANADALGDALDVRVDGRAVVIGWPQAMASTVSGTATLYRPSSAALDVTLPLAPDASGVQRIDVGTLAAGHWQLQVAWRSGDLDYLTTRYLVLGGTAGAP